MRRLRNKVILCNQQPVIITIMIIIICWRLSSPTTQVSLLKTQITGRKFPPFKKKKKKRPQKRNNYTLNDNLSAELLAPDTAQSWLIFPEQRAALHVSQRLPPASDLCPVISRRQRERLSAVYHHQGSLRRSPCHCDPNGRQQAS